KRQRCDASSGGALFLCPPPSAAPVYPDHKSRSTMADPALASDPELHGLSYIYERNGRHYCLTMATPTVVPNPPAKFSESA
ncbi:Os06g0479200, partial [Oryza sativa Japonica Group]